jgi:hypothetical protein
MSSKSPIFIGIIVFILVSVFSYKSCTKKTYAEVKAQFEICINSKMLEFQMTGDSKADIDKFNEIVDYCKYSIK